MASHYLRKYGVEATVNFELYELDGTDLVATAASATGDINLIRDEAGAEELDADAFVDEGVVYSLVVSATEMTAKRITIYIIDQSSPKIWLDKVLVIETYGNASAQHPFDLGTAATAMRGTNNAALASAWTATRAGYLDELAAANIPADVDKLIKILTNKWEITGNQLIMYDDDGTTPLYTFDLTRDGEPTEFNPKKRDPA